mgnify:FL=1
MERLFKWRDSGGPNVDVLVANELEGPFPNQSDQPHQTQLGDNYPNPFNPTTTIPFSLEKATKVKLTIYDMLGRSVQLITNKYLAAGAHEVRFNADRVGISSGMYLYTLELDNKRITKTMLLLK